MPQTLSSDIGLDLSKSTRISMSLSAVSSPRECEPKSHALIMGWFFLDTLQFLHIVIRQRCHVKETFS